MFKTKSYVNKTPHVHVFYISGKKDVLYLGAKAPAASPAIRRLKPRCTVNSCASWASED